MKRKTIWILIALWALAMFPARAEEEGPFCVSWVMEKRRAVVYEEDGTRRYEFLRDEAGNFVLDGLIVKTWHSDTGEVEAEDLPAEWLPLKNAEIGGGLCFAVPDQRLNKADIVVWRSGETEIAASGLNLWTRMQPLAFADGCFFTRSGRREQDDLAYYRIREDGMDIQEITGDSVYQFTGLDDAPYCGLEESAEGLAMVFLDMDRETVLPLSYGGDGDAPRVACFQAPWACGGDRMLMWGELEPKEDEKFTIYQRAFREKDRKYTLTSEHLSEVYRQQLFLYDRGTGEYREFLTARGKPVILTDMMIPECGSVYRAEDDSVYAVCRDYNPVNAGVGTYAGYGRQGRAMLVRISLESGDMEILYTAGFERPDFETMVRLCRKEFESPLWEGETSATITPEERETKQSLAVERPNQANPNGAFEGFPANFSIYVSG